MRHTKEFSLYAKYPLFFVVISCLLYVMACEEKIEKPDDSVAFAQKLTCEGCHTDQEVLQELAPGIDEPPPSSGGG